MKTTLTEAKHHHPLWTKYLLFTCIPRQYRDEVLGDLDELFAAARSERGLRRARQYYAFQAITTAAYFIVWVVSRSRGFKTMLQVLLVAMAAWLFPTEAASSFIKALLR